MFPRDEPLKICSGSHLACHVKNRGRGEVKKFGIQTIQGQGGIKKINNCFWGMGVWWKVVYLWHLVVKM